MRLRRTLSRLFIVLIPGLAVVALALLWWRYGSPTRRELGGWFARPEERSALITEMSTPCPGAPFRLPSPGFVGFLYNDPTIPYTPLNAHTGIDIFGNGQPGTVPVYAAYDGYLTRLPEWRSAVIVRIPRDPLDPSRQIWTYYAHMASKTGDSFISPEFPPGTYEKPIKQGDLIGFQGVFSGNSTFGIGMHVHFSIVLSEPDGSFKNEGRIGNTLDPSPYFGMTLNAAQRLTIPVRCGA